MRSGSGRSGIRRAGRLAAGEEEEDFRDLRLPAGTGGGWLGGVVAANPLTYGVAALRWRLGAGETEGLPSEPLCWAVTVGFAVAMVAASWWVAQRR